MPTYYLSLALFLCACAIVHLLFWSCWAEQQQHADRKRHIDESRNSESKGFVSTPMQVDSKLDRSEHRKRAQDRKDESASDGWGNRAERVVAIAAVIALVIYIAQAFFAAQQMSVMSQQITVDNRAWLTIEEPTIEKPVSVEYALKGNFKTRNLGKTPARIVSYFLRSSPMGRFHGFPTTYELPGFLSGSNIPVAPNGVKELLVIDPHFKLTQEEFDGLKDHDIIMVQFVLTYLDAFDKPRFTVGTYIYDPRMDKLSEMTLGPAEMN